MKKIFLTAFVGVLISSNPAWADGYSLLKACDMAIKFTERSLANAPEPGDLVTIGYCIGIVQGVSGANVMNTTFGTPNRVMCLPESGINSMQAIKSVVRFLKDRPDDLHRSDVPLITVALATAYPCK